jgi:hypothetical protein
LGRIILGICLSDTGMDCCQDDDEDFEIEDCLRQ